MLTYFQSDANDTGCFKGFWVEQDKGFGFAQLVDNNWNCNINNCMSICLVNCNLLIKLKKFVGPMNSAWDPQNDEKWLKS